MSQYGVHWDDDGRATLSAEGHSGEGAITGVPPAVAMGFAVMLARNARAWGAQWPHAPAGDPLERSAIAALQEATGEWRAPVVSEPYDPEADREEVLYSLSRVREGLEGALRQLDDAEQTLHS